MDFEDDEDGLPEDSFSFLTGEGHSGHRLDHFLAASLPEYSRSQLSNAIKNGRVHVDGCVVKASRRLHAGETVSGSVMQTEPHAVVPQQIAFDILYEDRYLIGLSKPPGLVVHPANGNPDHTLVNGLLYHCSSMTGVGDPVRPGIVHRLDKDTSGAMVVAKSDEVHRYLVEMFKSRLVQKRYHALVAGVPREGAGRIVAPIGRHPVNRKKMAIRELGGKFAASSWRVERSIGTAYSFLEVEIETGRTHQIRVHLASIGHPVAGDTVYGPSRQNPLFRRQMLHSSELRFEHPVTKKPLAVCAPLWPDVKEALECLESGEGVAC